MKFGFVLPNNWGIDDVGGIVDLAVEAEDLGFDSVWVNHHVLNVGYIAERLGEGPYHDALTVLDWAGARTSRVQLGTSVLVLPYLHPMVLAKQLATLDQLSGGRVIAGLGVGSLPDENAALGVTYDDRGSYSDESIDVLHRLWADGPATFHGEHFAFDDIVTAPKPVGDRVVTWIGGSGAPAQRRAARVGDGWHPMGSVGGLTKRMPSFLEKLDAAGRSRDDIVVAPRIDARQVRDEDAVQAWADAGADHLVIGTSSHDMAEIRANLADLGALVARTGS